MNDKAALESMNDPIERFADETLVFVKRLCSHLSGSTENKRDADEILISVVSILLQSPHDLTRFIKAGCTEISVVRPERTGANAEPVTTTYLRIMLAPDRGRGD